MLYIVRGPSGAGKSTFARKLQSKGLVDDVFEADMFMIDETGSCQFDPDRLKECHQLCQDHTRHALARGRTVAVANTFTKRWEIKPYAKMTSMLTVLTMEGRFKNVHGVPDHVVQSQRRRMEPWP